MGRDRRIRPPDLQDFTAELQRRRQAAIAAPKFVDDNFPAQAAFIRDPERLKAALCTRRAGKSRGAAAYLLKEAWETPGVACLYLALTRLSAKHILWGILKKLDKDFGLGCVFNKTELTAALPNGSIIFLAGADADPDEMEKLLGRAYRLVVIDEAASFRQDLAKMIYGNLQPAMSDLDGTICLIGTPGNVKRGLFYRVTTGQLEPIDAMWATHKWRALDNPYMREKTLRDLAKIDKERPLFKLTPLFKQNYEGEWFVDESKLVYRFDEERNIYETLPKAAYTYVLGVDLGFNDDSAFMLLAWSEHDPTLYGIESFKKASLDITGVAQVIQDYQRRFPIQTVVVDGANKQAVAEMSNRHGLALVPADKRNKADFIDLLNSDMIQGRIKLQADKCAPLIDEWANLIWDQRTLERSGKREEAPALPNHAADSFLYGWRLAYNYLATEVKDEPKRGTEEFRRLELEEMQEQARRSAMARARPQESWGSFGDGFPSDSFPT